MTRTRDETRCWMSPYCSGPLLLHTTCQLDTMQRTFITSSRSLARASICRTPSHALRIPRLQTPNAHSPLYSRSFAYSLHARNARSSQNPTTPPPPSEDDQLTLLPPSDSSKPSGVIKVDEPRKSISFNCGVEDCGVRQTHEFTKRSYERGIVIVQCPGCKNR
jgi:hypothetical protein